MHRICKQCGLSSEMEAFPKAFHKNGKQYYRHKCVKCYSLDKSHRRREIGKWFVSLKQSSFCSRCGNKDYRVLVFHHRIPGEKDMNLSDMVRIGRGKTSIQNEIQKCDVLCANCHMIVHWELDNL